MNKYEEALQTIGSIDLQDYPSADSFLDSNEENYPTSIPLGMCYPEEMGTLQEAIKKAKALDRALELLKQKRENAQNNLHLKTIKKHPLGALKLLKEDIATYNECIITIEMEIGRKREGDNK